MTRPAPPLERLKRAGATGRLGHSWLRCVLTGSVFREAVACLAFSSVAWSPLLLPAAESFHPVSDSSAAPSFVGESLIFQVEWDPPWYLFFLPPMEAGEAEISVAEEVDYQGTQALKIVFHARSSGTFVKLVGLKVDDHLESITDSRSMCTLAVLKKLREGKRMRDIEVVYIPEDRRLRIREVDVSTVPPKVRRDEYRDSIPACVRDPFAALYWMRHSDFFVGARYVAVLGDNDRIKEVEAAVEKNETIETPAGRYKTWKVNTAALIGGLFKEGGQFRVWLTDDDTKMPVQFEARVSLGTVRGKLKSARYGNAADVNRSRP